MPVSALWSSGKTATQVLTCAAPGRSSTPGPLATEGNSSGASTRHRKTRSRRPPTAGGQTTSGVRNSANMSPLRFAAASVHQNGQGAARRWRGRAKALPPRVQQVAEAHERAPPELTGLAMAYLPTADLATSFPPCVAGLTPAECGDADSHYARVICALCYLAMGGLDEAHNMVTPLSWESRTPFSGPPVINSPAVQEASYVHTLIHRREGQHIGEFGTGFNNAGYWARRTGVHPIMEPLWKEATEAAKGERHLEEHMRGHEGGWSPSHFVRLCEETARTGDAAATTFCQRVAVAEWKLLVGYCYDRM